MPMPSPSSQGAFHTPVIGAATRGQSSQATVRTALAVAAGLLVASGVFVAFRPAYAGLGDIFALGIAWIFNIFTGWAGQLLLILVDWLIRIAQYNDFVNSAPVANGWSIVRDVTNMFFILVLLVIAFGTILGVDAYSYKNKMLSRLLIMAVVVNFSRTICGLLIDFAQVVMLTFVYGFKEAAGGNFADALCITRVMQARETIDSSQAGSSGDTISAWTIAVAMILAFFMVLISMFVIAMMIITLAIRIVYLWLLIVLSPLAFFLKAVPGGSASGYYGMWWKMFTSQVIVGPVMAFFLWLSLVSVASNNLTSVGGTGGGSQEQVSGAISAAFQSDEIGAFIMGLCLLMGGLQISKQISAESAGAAPGLAKKALSVGKAAAKRTVAGADRLTGGAIATGGVPIVSRWAGDARLARAQEKRQKESRAAAISETLSPTMKRAVANEFAFTEQGRANKAAVQRDLLKEAAKKPPKDAAGLGEVHQWRKDLRNTAEKAEAKKPGSGAAILKDLSEFEQKRPSLIIDKNETDPKEKARQEQSFRKSASGFNAARMADMDASELTEQFLAFANPKAIVKARETASGDQLTKLAEMGESETDIIAKQRQLRSQPENFALLSEQERAQQIKGMDKDQLAALASSPSIRPDHLQGEEVLKALASTTALSDGSTGLAQKVSVDLDYDKLRGNED
ncbi:MAG TPA: hypothetical protein VLC10_02805, partial [Patescibacteria group bacterium]|nr:hypothetical protein [Patescibacteria group bacterium]